MGKKVVFVHYRTGERDGVGLEIEKRAEIFTKLGGEVYYLSGFDGLDRENAFIVPEFDIRSNLNKTLIKLFFEEPIFDEDVAQYIFNQQENKLFEKFDKIFKELKPDLVFVHNVFSYAYNIPATKALIRVLDKYSVKTVCVNHDFWFERDKFIKPTYQFIQEELDVLPPDKEWIVKHQVINSIAAGELEKRRNIVPEKIADFFDFNEDPPIEDDYNKDLLESFGIKKNDIVILHATRIRERKAIENAIRYAAEFAETIREKAPLKINGKNFDKDSKVHLFFNNFVEIDSFAYYEKLKELANELGVNAIWAGDKFSTTREQKDGKIYSFWDAYIFADVITFTSTWEGFGNQLLEAIFFKKLTVIFEYPVFEVDIKKEGYDYISLGNEGDMREDGLFFVPDNVIKTAVSNTIETLKDEHKLKTICNSNLEIAKANHDKSLLLEDLKKLYK